MGKTAEYVHACVVCVVCVCACVRAYVWVHKCVFVCICMYVLIYVHACLHVGVCMSMNICGCVHMCIYTYKKNPQSIKSVKMVATW